MQISHCQEKVLTLRSIRIKQVIQKVSRVDINRKRTKLKLLYLLKMTYTEIQSCLINNKQFKNRLCINTQAIINAHTQFLNKILNCLSLNKTCLTVLYMPSQINQSFYICQTQRITNSFLINILRSLDQLADSLTNLKKFPISLAGNEIPYINLIDKLNIFKPNFNYLHVKSPRQQLNVLRVESGKIDYPFCPRHRPSFHPDTFEVLIEPIYPLSSTIHYSR